MLLDPGGEANLEIASYELDLDVDFKRSTVNGIVSVKVRGTEGALSLDAVDMKIDSVRINGRDSRFKFDNEEGRLRIPGVPSKESTVTITYTKQVADDVIVGLYKSRYGKDHMLVTDLEPAKARTVFPCKDEPLYKAVFKLTVTTDRGISVISNTLSRSEEVTKDGRMKFEFDPTPRMSTYLFFLGVGSFEERSIASGKTRLIIASRPGQSDRGKFILETSAAVLKGYEKYFRIAYPLKKLHLVALPEYHTGAMENWGAITSRESFVLLGQNSSAADQRTGASVMAHEIAHQWFGDLVTMKWWDDLWLNESFASFMDPMMIEKLHPEWDPWRDFLRFEAFRSLNADALSTTHPIQAKVKSVEEVEGIVDDITYGKGAAVLRMLESYVGKEAFRRGVSAYLRRFEYSNARGEDFWEALGKESGLPVSRIARVWITKAGFPVVGVTTSKGKVTFSQSRFQLNGEETDGSWPVPLNLQVDGKSRTILLDGKSMSVSARKPSEVVVNHRRTGFYSVHYDKGSYDRIARRFAKLHSHDRAGIVNDLYLFLQAGKVEPELYFRFVSLAARLADLLVTEIVTDHLANLRAIADEAGIVRESYTEFYPAQIERIGLFRKKGEDDSVSTVRETLAAQLARTNMDYARKLARRFDGYQEVEPDLRAAVAVSYAVTRGEAAFDPLLRLVKEASNELERAKVYPALTSFEDPSLVEKTLELGISGEVSRSDSGFTILGAASNPKARATLWRWLVKRYDRVHDIYGGSFQFYGYLNRAIPRCGIGHESEVRRFISGKRFEEAESTFRRTFELLDINSGLRERLLAS